MKKHILICFLILFSACKSLKNKTDKKNTKTLNAKELLKKIKANKWTAKTVHVSGKIAYESYKVNFKLQILKDKKMGIKITMPFLGLTLAKVLMRPKKISYYFPTKKEFYEGDYEILEEMLGISLGFSEIQNLLLGNALFSLKNFEITTQKTENGYKMQSQKLKKLLFKMLVNSENFKIKKQKWTLLKDKKNIEITYDFQEHKIPSFIKILFETLENKGNVEILYKKIRYGNAFDFSYKIPEKYELKK